MRALSSVSKHLIGLTLLIGPMTLTLALTGANEDKVTREVKNELAVAVEELTESDAKAEGVVEVAGEPEAPKPKQTIVAAIKEKFVKPKQEEPPKAPEKTVKVPVFAGFEHERFQRHDALIAKLVESFNRNPAAWAGSTPDQAVKIPHITAAQVKSHMIQETGGQDAKSRAAWKKDPLQANVPGDWSSFKKYVGLHKPRNRNEGSLEANLKAGIMILVRKGFSEGAQPAANRPRSSFNGWRWALQRYNGRKDLTAEGIPYRDVYAGRILKRASSPKAFVDIPIRKKKRAKRR